MQRTMASVLSRFPQWPVYKKSFIENEKGDGLIATRNMNRGDPIIWESAMAVDETIGTMGSVNEYNVMLAETLKGMGTDFVHEFFQLPCLSQEIYGKLGAYFDRCALPCPSMAKTGNKAIRALGIQSAMINHSCIPNAQHSLVKGDESEGTRDKYFITVRACVAIFQGQEITVSYAWAPLMAPYRALFMNHHYGFLCCCIHCADPLDHVEGLLSYVASYAAYMDAPAYIDSDPVAVLKVAHEVITSSIQAGIFDARYGRLMEQCAVLCAYHSDFGRATAFLRCALAAYFMVEGFEGFDFTRGLLIEDEPNKLPGSETTEIGNSQAKECHKIGSMDDTGLKLACMYDVPGLEYVRLCDVDERSDLESSSCDSRDTDDENDKQQSRVENLDELVAELEAEKKEHDEERLQHGQSGSKNKGQASASNRKQKKKKKRSEKKEKQKESQDFPTEDILAEMGRLKLMGKK